MQRRQTDGESGQEEDRYLDRGDDGLRWPAKNPMVSPYAADPPTAYSNSELMVRRVSTCWTARVQMVSGSLNTDSTVSFMRTSERRKWQARAPAPRCRVREVV